MDHAQPITVGDAIRYAASTLKLSAELHRREAEVLKAKADAIDDARYAMETEAVAFDRYADERAANEKEPSDGS